MRIKRALIILLSMLTTLIFVGCSNNSNKSVSRFYETGEVYEIDGSDYEVNVDRKTDNVYLVSIKDRSITPLYNKDGKISKYSDEKNNYDGSTVDKSRFSDTGETYEIDNADYGVFVDTKTDNTYLVSTHDRVIIPLYDTEGNIAKYSSYK